MSAYDYQADFYMPVIPPNGICPLCLSRVCEHASIDNRKRLTPQQLKIVKLIGNGLTQKEIAEIMDLTPGTVKQYAFHVRIILGLTSSKEVMAWAFRHAKELENA